MTRRPWNRCEHTGCRRPPTWTVTYRGVKPRTERLCGDHAAECAFYGAGILTPIEAAERRYHPNHNQEAA